MINGGYEIEHMREALEIFKDWPDYEDRVKAVFTRVTPCDRASQEELGRALGFPVAGIIPNAPPSAMRPPPGSAPAGSPPARRRWAKGRSSGI